MRPWSILILFHVLLTGTHGSPGVQDEDWFWNRNFTDGSAHDNDPEREFWRHTDSTDDSDGGYTSPAPDSLWISYYKKRQQQALTCTDYEHRKLGLEEFGKPGCQLCTCNKKGMMLCTAISCSQTGDEVGLIHEKILKENRVKNQGFREAADRCDGSSTSQDISIDIPECTCTCVLPNVLSCPKSCFYQGGDIDITTGDDYETTEIYTSAEWTTEYVPTGTEEETTDYDGTTNNYDPTTSEEETTDDYTTESDVSTRDDYDETTDDYDRSTDDYDHTDYDTTENYIPTTEDYNPTTNDDSNESNGDDYNEEGVFIFINIGRRRGK